MSVAQQLSPEAKWKLAVEMPIDRLMAIVRGQPSEIDAPTAISALQYKQKEQTASQGVLAQQQLQGKPKVADSLMQGLTRIPAPNMETMQAANGGIVGYADGGDVRHFQVGGRTPFEGFQQNAHPIPFESSMPYPDDAYSSHYLRMLNRGRLRTPEEYNEFIRAGREAQQQPVQQYVSSIPPTGAGEFNSSFDSGVKDFDFMSPFAGKRPPVVKPPVVKLPAQPSSNVPRSDIPAEEAAAMDARYKAQGEFGSEQQRAGIATLAQPLSFAETTAGAVTGRVDSNFTKAMREITGNTDSYLDAMTAAFKKMTPTEEERKVRGNEKKGVMALKVAQQLLQPGRSSAAAWGGAAGEIATLTQAYADEDRKDKKAMLGAEINMLGAQAQLAQGNTKIAVDMYQRAESLALDGIRFDADKFFKTEELRLKELGLSDARAAAGAADAVKRYVVDRTETFQRYMIDAKINAFTLRGNKEDARASATTRGQNVRALTTLRGQLARAIDPAEKKQINADIAYFTDLLKNDGLGITTLNPSPGNGLFQNVPPGNTIPGMLGADQ